MTVKPVQVAKWTLVLAGLVTAAAASRTIASGSQLGTLGVLGAIGAALALVAPRLALLGVVTLSATLVVAPGVPLAFGGIQTDAAEALTFLLIGAAVLRTLVFRIGFPGLAWRTLLLVSSACLGAGVGLGRGFDRQLIQGELKTYLLLLLVIPLTTFFSTPELRSSLERSIHVVGAVATCYVLLAVATGMSVPSDSPTQAFNTLDTVFDVTRLRPPLLYLVVLATMLSIAKVIQDRLTLGSGVLISFYFVLLFMSFTRAIYAGVVVGTLFLFGSRLGGRRTPWRPITALGGAATLALLAGVGLLGATAEAVVERASSAFSPDLSEESSYRDRADEVSAAAPLLLESPLLGQGLGVVINVQRPGIGATPQHYVHNSYLLAFLHLGLFGLLATLGMLVGFLRARPSGAPDVGDRRRAAAGAATAVAFAVQAVVEPLLLHRPALVVLALAITFASTGEGAPRRLERADLDNQLQGAPGPRPGHLRRSYSR
jgi:O-antigen ligase